MPQRLHISFLLALLLMPLFEVSATEEKMDAIETLDVLVGAVVRLDKESRILTLRNKKGIESTFTLGLEVQNIDQINPGDQVMVHYFNAFAIALGAKNAEMKEYANLLQIEGTQQGMQAGSRKTRSITAVGVVEAIDPQKRLVTVRVEEQVVVSVSEDFDLSNVTVEDEVALSYTEYYVIKVEPASKILGAVSFKSTSVAVGIGYEWGEGKLTMYDGSTYDFDFDGISMLDVGISLVKAEGNAFRVIESTDIEGVYWVAEIGISYGDGVSAITMKNSHNVILRLSSKLKGMKATLAAERLRIKNVRPTL